MPSNLVKPGQEKAWDRAKEAAAKSKGIEVADLGDDDYGLVTHIFQNMTEDSQGFETIGDFKRKDCKCGQYDSAGKCACNDASWAFAPLYGDGKGNSGAANHVSTTGGQTPSPSSPAFPGAGGVNSPGVGGGQNSGTGPLMTSISEADGDEQAKRVSYKDFDHVMAEVEAGRLMFWVVTNLKKIAITGKSIKKFRASGHTLLAKDPDGKGFRMQSGNKTVYVMPSSLWSSSASFGESVTKAGLEALDEALDFAIRTSNVPNVSDAPPEIDPGIIMDGDLANSAMIAPPTPPISPPLASDGSPTVMSVLIAAVHRQFTHAGDLMFANGYMDQEKRIALSGCVGDALRQLTLSMQAKCPWAAVTPLDAGLAKTAVMESK